MTPIFPNFPVHFPNFPDHFPNFLVYFPNSAKKGTGTGFLDPHFFNYGLMLIDAD